MADTSSTFRSYGEQEAVRETSNALGKIIKGQSVGSSLKGISDPKTRLAVKQNLEKEINQISKKVGVRIATRKASQKKAATPKPKDISKPSPKEIEFNFINKQIESFKDSPSGSFGEKTYKRMLRERKAFLKKNPDLMKN